MTPPSLKPVEWMGSALADLRRFPGPVQDVVGYALHVAQLGEHPSEAKRLRGELAGILEIVDDFDRGTYRAVYTVKLAGAVYVLHVFQKEVHARHRHAAARDRPDQGTLSLGESAPRGELRQPLWTTG